MNKQSFALAFLSAGLLLATPSVKASVAIMPFGDSVTANGSSPESSYRYWLYTMLVNAGYDVDFIGSRSGVGDGSPENDAFDQDYEGGDGWTSLDGVDNINWIAGENPDIVLLDLGANDIGQGWQTPKLETTTTNLMQIIEGFRADNPNVMILLAEPTHWITTDPNEKKAMSKLSSAVARAAKIEKKAGANIRLVNLSSGFSAKKDTKDGVHPNLRGEQKIAKKYYSAIKKVLGRP